MNTSEIVSIDPFAFQGSTVFNWIETVKPGHYKTKVALKIALPTQFNDYDYIKESILDKAGLCVKRADVILRNNVLSIRKGWEFDGASGPAIDGVTNMLAAIVHDALWDVIRRGRKSVCSPDLSFSLTDWMYRRVMIAQGGSSFRAWTHWSFIRTFGWMWRITLGRT